MSDIEEWVGDFGDRLERAAESLQRMSAAEQSDVRYSHLRSKREGVLLAVSYLDEYLSARLPAEGREEKP